MIIRSQLPQLRVLLSVLRVSLTPPISLQPRAALPSAPSYFRRKTSGSSHRLLPPPPVAQVASSHSICTPNPLSFFAQPALGTIEEESSMAAAAGVMSGTGQFHHLQQRSLTSTSHRHQPSLTFTRCRRHPSL